MIFSVIAFAVMNAIVKYLTAYNVYQIVFFRAIGTLAFTIPLIITYKIPVLGTHKKLLLLICFLGVISLIFFFQSLKIQYNANFGKNLDWVIDKGVRGSC